MSDSRYPAARAVAPKVRQHFLRHLARHGASHRVSHVPPAADIEAMVDAAFWASLRREEGYVPRLSIALVDPATIAQPMYFAQALPPAPTALAKMAPAVERPGIHLGVWRVDDEMRVWGTLHDVPDTAPVIEVASPGLLVVKHHRRDGSKFVNVAVLEGDQVKIIVENASAIPECPEMLSSLRGADGTPSLPHINILIDLAVSMRAHGRGGTLLVVPSTGTWMKSILRPIPYAVHPPFNALADLMRRPAEERLAREWQEETEDIVAALAGLTAVDGATIINDRFELLAFGAKLTRGDGYPTVEEATVTEPIDGSDAAVVHPSRLGGTRHLSATQFVHDQPGSLALVASQDGRFTVFSWSTRERRVHARRVEALLL
ncbi:MAG: hypothetical protein LBQ09_07240 [Acidobacteriaceae bacterium]|jgi:hypothetical protein|nr:hypothetical protein [Acidobacteriaceae bacterium]